MYYDEDLMLREFSVVVALGGLFLFVSSTLSAVSQTLFFHPM